MTGMTRRRWLAASAAFVATPGAAQPEGLAGANASLVADALNAVGIDPRAQSMSPDIRLVTTPGATVMGRAVTTKWEPVRGDMPPDAIRRHVFALIDRAPAGSVWVVASGTEELVSMFGDLIGFACKRNGLAGAVTDSGCRDVAAMEAFDFPVFAKGTVLFGPGRVIQPVASDVPVVCGGVRVRPGDLVVADVDGVIVVPAASVESVSRAAAELAVKENDVRRRIERGDALADAYSL